MTHKKTGMIYQPSILIPFKASYATKRPRGIIKKKGRGTSKGGNLSGSDKTSHIRQSLSAFRRCAAPVKRSRVERERERSRDGKKCSPRVEGVRSGSLVEGSFPTHPKRCIFIHPLVLILDFQTKTFPQSEVNTKLDKIVVGWAQRRRYGRWVKRNVRFSYKEAGIFRMKI